MSNCHIQTKSSQNRNQGGQQQSSVQTTDHLNANYQYLMNQIKIKSAALAKASNLIQILKVQLEVQKNSKNQAVLNAQQEMQDYYQIEIANLNAKIQQLQANVDKKRISRVLTTQMNLLDSVPKQQSRILRRSCSRTLNRSKSKQNINGKQNNSKKVPTDASFQMKMYRKMLMQNSAWEAQFIMDIQQTIRKQTKDIEESIQNLQQNDLQFQELVLNYTNNSKKSSILTKIDQLFKTISRQNDIIYQMKLYQNQMQQIVRSFATKMNAIHEQKSWTRIDARVDLTDIIKQICEILNRWKSGCINREKSMENQNKELRQIIQEMISLMHRKTVAPAAAKNYA